MENTPTAYTVATFLSVPLLIYCLRRIPLLFGKKEDI